MNEKMNEKIKVMDIEIAKEREKMSICNVLFQTETETEIKKKSLQDAFKEVFENQRTDFPIYFIYFHWIEIEKCRKVDHYVTELIDDYSKELSCIIKGAPFIPVGLTVYKGIKNNGNNVKEYDIWDKNFHIEGFFSTSLRKEISETFAGDNCCLLTVIVKASLFRGLFMEINTHYEGEYEILFDNDFIGYENIIPKNYDSTEREYRVELDLKYLDEDEKEDEKEEISKPKRKISEKKSTPKRPKKNLFKIKSVNKSKTKSVKTKKSKTKKSDTKKSDTKKSKTKKSKTNKSKTNKSKTNKSKTKSVKTKKSKTNKSKTKSVKTKKSKTKSVKTKKSKTKKSKTK